MFKRRKASKQLSTPPPCGTKRLNTLTSFAPMNCSTVCGGGKGGGTKTKTKTKTKNYHKNEDKDRNRDRNRNRNMKEQRTAATIRRA